MFSLEEKKAARSPYSGPKGATGQLGGVQSANVARGLGVMVLNKRVDLDLILGRNSSPWVWQGMGTDCWRAVGAPSLEVPKAGLDGAVGSQI